MATNIFLPQWGMGMQEATIIKWLKKEGDIVKKGDPLNGRLVIETKSLLSENGKKRELSFPLIANETVDKGGVLVRIKTNFRCVSASPSICSTSKPSFETKRNGL